MKRKRAEIIGTTPVDDDNQVVTMKGVEAYRRKPCEDCPWVVENTGSFPPGVFIVSARTAWDMSTHAFGCHEHGPENPVTCAGFLLRGAEHSLSARMRASNGTLDLRQVHEDGRELHAGYRTMAIANGVDPDEPALILCRASSYEQESDQ